MNRQELIEKWSKPQVVDAEGFVRLVDFMGDDPAIPQAARVSYAGGTKTVREDSVLTRFLMRHEHYSPFAMAQVKLHLRLPIYVHNQFVRHDRFAWNVMSGRYSEMPKEKWQPADPTDVRGQGKGNKQVGNGVLDPMHQGVLMQDVIEFNLASQAKYEELLDLGMCREQARTVLPMGQYTEAYVTANLGDWLLFLKARLSPHAQVEIKLFAEAIHNIFVDLFPNTMSAFDDYQFNSVTFSAQEMLWIREALASNVKLLDANPEDRKKSLELVGIESGRERQEFWKKLRG